MMNVLRKVSKARGGQAAIEFIVSLLVVLFFLLFLMSLAFLFVVSEYMDYATFMAARTLKSGYGSRNDQERNARIVFEEYTKHIQVQGLAQNFKMEVIQTDPTDIGTSGVISSYEANLFYLPPLFLGEETLPSRISLGSEAHLGREPGFEECFNYFDRLVRTLNIPNMDNFSGDMDDNGC